MAAPKQARARGTAARQAGTAAKARDKGTRGGRPEPQPASVPVRRPGDGQGQARGQGGGQGASGPQAGAARAQGAAVSMPAAVRTPLWLRLATLVLAVGGLGVSVWLTIAHYTTASILACSDSGVVNCTKVTTSPEAVVLGIFPVAVLGLAFFVAMTALTSPWAWRAPWPALRWARLGSAIVGMGFVLYLVYTELITLDAICLWCTSVHVITFLLFCLIVFSSTTVGEPATAKDGR